MDDFRKMKNVILIVVLLSLPHVGRAAPSLGRVLYGASFTNGYQDGDQLCDIGASNGTWGVVQKGVAIAEKDADRGMIMYCSTPAKGIVFSPLVEGTKKTVLEVASICSGAYEEMTDVPAPTMARAAFAIYAPPFGATNFIGWIQSQGCWTNLYPSSGAQTPELGVWQQVMARFLSADNGSQYVQYLLKREGDAHYVPLYAENGDFWFKVDGDDGLGEGMRGKLEFSGEGGLEYLAGGEPCRGLIVGTGRWRDLAYCESVNVTNLTWTVPGGAIRPPKSETDGRSYVIAVDKGEEPISCEMPRTHADTNTVETVELEVVFSASNDDETIPERACARMRMVDKDGDGRFVCLVGGQWETNNAAVRVDAKYTVKMVLDRGASNPTVSYWYKEGYGLEGAAYKPLGSGTMLPKSSKKVQRVDFEGGGTVHEIRGWDATE